MITIISIQINNFLSHENTKIDFKDSDQLLLDGSSGSGKSSIVDALIWCIYGEARVDSRFIVRRGAKTCTVTLKLTDGTTEYVISRSVSDKGKHTLSATYCKGGVGENYRHIERTGIKDIQDWIEKELIGASYKLFINSVAYPQENVDGFVKQNASKRKDLLLEIVKAGDIDGLYEKARERLSSSELELAGFQSEVSSLKLSISREEENAKNISIYEKKLSDIDTESKGLLADIEKQDGVLSSFKGKEDAIASYRVLRSKIKSQILSRTSQIDVNNRKIAENESIDVNKAKAALVQVESGKPEIELLRSKVKKSSEDQSKMNSMLADKPNIVDRTDTIERLNKQLIPLIKDTGKCPSGDLCPFIGPIKNQIEFLENQIKDMESEMADSKKAFDKWSEEFSKIPTPEDITEIYPRLNSLEWLAERITENSKNTIASYEAGIEENKDLRAINSDLDRQNKSDAAEVDELTRKISMEESLLGSVDLDKLKVSQRIIKDLHKSLMDSRDSVLRMHSVSVNALKNIESLRGRMDVVSKLIEDTTKKIYSMKMLKEAFSPRGIKAVVIDYVIPTLEERINAVLGKLSDFRVKLETQRAAVSGESVVEGLFIEIFNERGELHDYNAFSGGEKIRITVAISEALASMQKCGFRILDEAIVSLDKDSTEGFVHVLGKIQSKFAQIICISHIQDIKDMFERRLTVTKVNGISKVN